MCRKLKKGRTQGRQKKDTKHRKQSEETDLGQETQQKHSQLPGHGLNWYKEPPPDGA